MKTSKLFTILILPILIMALFAGVVSATGETSNVPTPLDNVRSFAAAQVKGGVSYANAGGTLLASDTQGWHTVALPAEVIAAGVAIHGESLYVGAANETSLFRSTDTGKTWLRVPLAMGYNGAVNSLAIDSSQGIVYAGTDQGTIYRLRDVGSSLVIAGQQTVSEPVLQLAADSTGAGLAFARTQTHLYQAENGGLNWKQLEMTSLPTALAIGNTSPATVYVGTMDNGVMKSNDGFLWLNANEGLGLVAGSRLKIDALAIDPAQPSLLYVASSYLFGHSEVHQAPVGVAMSENSGEAWQMLQAVDEIAVSALMPVSGERAAVYALFANSRTPFALGVAQPLLTATALDASTSWVTLVNENLWTWVVALAAVMSAIIGILLIQRSRAQQGKLATQNVGRGG